MRIIKVKPVEVVGHCRARLSAGDEFEIKGTRLENLQESNLCVLALGHFPPTVKQLQGGKHFYAHLTCPECLAREGQENRVVFLLGHADKWELCQAISEYRRLCRQLGKEPVIAGQLGLEATRYQKQGEYSKAALTMVAAVAELKRNFV
jgi:uncharacterized repeat protein (TIGR04076 family)